MIFSIDRCELGTHDSGQSGLSLAQASFTIQNGALVAYATETFFALGCSALHAEAIASVFAAKRRKPDMALPVIIGNIEQLFMLTDTIGQVEQSLITTFWPAPLSILFTAKASVPPILTGGTGLVAVRLSPHADATNLAIAAGLPLVSTSANISGRPAVTHAEELDAELLSGLTGYYHESSPPQGGLASTLVRCEQGALRILREGTITAQDFLRAGYCLL